MGRPEEIRRDYEHVATLLWSAAVDIKMAIKVVQEIDESVVGEGAPTPESIQTLAALGEMVTDLTETSEMIQLFFQEPDDDRN